MKKKEYVKKWNSRQYAKRKHIYWLDIILSFYLFHNIKPFTRLIIDDNQHCEKRIKKKKKN